MYPNLRIVLVNPSHPGNIGAVARAMKTMGLEALYLVGPKQFPCAEATARASGADDVLARAVVCESLEQALTGCGLVAGTSARVRTLPWPLVDAREGAQRLVSAAERDPVALLFGRESSGLSNAELARCHYHICIPSNPEYSSLNLAAAVQILAYELRLAAGAGVPRHRSRVAEAAPQEEMEGFFAHLERVIIDLGFLDPANPRQLPRRLRRMFSRMRPDRVELNILRGILTAVQKRPGPPAR
jgi:tRNA (cytidine32/uridine32-2'-O)-methyltransferase